MKHLLFFGLIALSTITVSAQTKTKGILLEDLTWIGSGENPY